jgi:hypothetical protein
VRTRSCDLGELTFGSQQGDQSQWLWSNDELLRQWCGPGRLLVLFNRWLIFGLWEIQG